MCMQIFVIYIAHDCRYISGILFWGARFMENGSDAKPSIYIYIYMLSLSARSSRRPDSTTPAGAVFGGLCIGG